MTAALALLASVLTVNLPSADRAEVFVAGLPDGDPESAVAPAKVCMREGVRVLDFGVGENTNGVVRNFFRGNRGGAFESEPHPFRELTLLTDVDPLQLFLRDCIRTFGPAYLPSRICRVVRNGQASPGLLVARPDALFAAAYFGNAASDYDIILDGRVNFGDDAAWKALVGVALEEGFGPGHADNRLRLLGCNETGTTNLEFPVLIDMRSLMVCALACDFCESVPDVYACRSRVQPGQSRTGFRFLVGERPSRSGSSTPLLIHRQMLQDDGYCRAYADLVYEACVRTNGELAVSSCRRRIDRRLAEMKAVCGDDADAAKAIARFEELKARIARRSAAYVAGCNLAKLLSVPVPLAVDAEGRPLPGYGRYRGLVALASKAGAGKVYYSDDGCDPRDERGELNPLAREYAGPFEVSGRCRLRARTLSPEGTWSALEMVNLNFQ